LGDTKEAPMPVIVQAAPRTTNGWVKAQRETLASYLDELLVAMKLTGWELTVDLSTASKACAEISLVYAQQRATMWLSADFLEQDATWQRDTLVHELVHLVLNPMLELSDQALTGAMKPGLVQMHGRVLAHAIEERTDLIAGLLSPSLAVPGFQDPSRKTRTKAAPSRVPATGPGEVPSAVQQPPTAATGPIVIPAPVVPSSKAGSLRQYRVER
jgi:hypothetical protein